MTKPHAGNTGRHEDSILWDRLRADLERLGTAYGVPFEPFRSTDNKDCGCVTLSCPHTGDTAALAATLPIESDAVSESVVESTDVVITGNCTSSGTGKFDIAFERTEPDYDAILLAARKRREALAWMDEPLSDDERDICHQMWDEQERAERVAAALSKPLDHEPRLGWKPGDCE